MTPIAMEAVRRTLMEIAKVIASVGAELFAAKQYTDKMARQWEEANVALGKARKFLSSINDEPAVATKQDSQRQVALVHVIDHLGRLLNALEPSESVSFNYLNKEGHDLAEKMTRVFDQLATLDPVDLIDFVEQAERNSKTIAELRKQKRKTILETTALNRADVDDAIETVYTIHWMDRIAYHLWRSLHHLKRCQAHIIKEDSTD